MRLFVLARVFGDVLFFAVLTQFLSQGEHLLLRFLATLVGEEFRHTLLHGLKELFTSLAGSMLIDDDYAAGKGGTHSVDGECLALLGHLDELRNASLAHGIAALSVLILRLSEHLGVLLNRNGQTNDCANFLL